MMNNGKETTEQEPNSWKELWAEGRHETLIDANHLFDVCGPVFGFPFAAAAAASLSLSLPFRTLILTSAILFLDGTALEMVGAIE